MNRTVQYRNLRPDEAGTASELARRVFQECVAEFHPLEGRQEFHRYAAPEALRQREASDYVTFVAEQDGEIIGMLHLKDDQHIAMLFVGRMQQRKGVGRGLLRVATEHARRSSHLVRAITVASSPNAIEAYQRLGFIPIGTEQTAKGLRFLAMQYDLGSKRADG